MKKLLLIPIHVLFISCVGCSKDDNATMQTQAAQRTFGVFTVQTDNTTVYMNGDIDSNIGSSFNALRTAFPDAKRIVMQDVPGSSDDEANLVVSKQMHDLGYSFHLTSTSVIASDAVDMYVGGINRTREAGSQIGVHSWGSDPGEPIATSYPVGHEVHLFYINYYTSVGFNQQAAEAFYYFTINAAPAESIHWMTDTEIETYNLITE